MGVTACAFPESSKVGGSTITSPYSMQLCLLSIKAIRWVINLLSLSAVTDRGSKWRGGDKPQETLDKKSPGTIGSAGELQR